MLKRLFVSTSVYALAHQLGMAEAVQEVGRQIEWAQSTAPVGKVTLLPAVKTIARIARFAEATLHVDAGATYIGQARSRAFHEAFESGLPGWITVDDDIEASTATVGAMLEALDDLKPRIVLTPYALRAPGTEGRLAVDLPNVRVERTRGGKLLLCERGHGGGMGFVGMNRAAMQLVADACPADLGWVDEDGRQKRALFYERVEDMMWWGEDTSFFRWRVPAEVTVELLLAGIVSHAGVAVDLATL